jgi:hypothetical protein
MVIINPNLEYGPYEDHILKNPTSLSTPSVQLTCMPQDGLMKL